MFVGVLLLNAVLTVRAHQANSHKEKGWEQFTDAVVSWLNQNSSGLVFLLWGSYAQKKGSAIDRVCGFELFKPVERENSRNSCSVVLENSTSGSTFAKRKFPFLIHPSLNLLL